MNKNEYLSQLSNLLTDLSLSERQDAMLYYEDYISDAGEENEASVLQELGSPVTLAAEIKSGLGLNPSIMQRNEASSIPNNSVIAQTSYQQNTQQQYDQQSNQQNNAQSQQGDQSSAYSQASQQKEAKPKDPVKIALFVILAIVTSPIWLSIISTVFSILLGFLTAIVGVVIATFAIGISFIIVCVMLLAVGIIKLFSLPGCAVLLMGIGLLFGGLGIYALVLCYFLCSKTLPWLFYGSINLCKKCIAKTHKTVTA